MSGNAQTTSEVPKNFEFLKGTENGKLLQDTLKGKVTRKRSTITDVDRVLILNAMEEGGNIAHKGYEVFKKKVKSSELSYDSFRSIHYRLKKEGFKVHKKIDGTYELIGGNLTKKTTIVESKNNVDLHYGLIETLYDNSKENTENAILKVMQKQTLSDRLDLIVKLLKPNKNLMSDALKKIL